MYLEITFLVSEKCLLVNPTGDFSTAKLPPGESPQKVPLVEVPPGESLNGFLFVYSKNEIWLQSPQTN